MTSYTNPQTPTLRPLHIIAREIEDNWRALYADKPKRPGFYLWAMPYLEAMTALSSIRDKYVLDSGESIVLYFLANCAGWRGDFAKAKKAELTAHLNTLNPKGK